MLKNVQQIAYPGTHNGPCAASCGHLDCIHKKALAARTCAKCGSPLGYCVDFHYTEDGEYEHVTCPDDVLQEVLL